MNEFTRLEKLAEQLKTEYPKGTRIELECMGNDPRPIESGTRGTVELVDDLATIHCIFDNGRRLGIISGEDQFHKLTPRELLEEKLDKISEEKQIAYYEKVFKETVPDIDWRSLKEAYKNGDMSYPTELLRILYDKYLEVYDPVLESGNGMVTVPGIAKVADGTLYIALLDIDTNGQGEHWGTTFFTPNGVLQDQNEAAWNKIKPFIPYEYWYVPWFESECHIYWGDCPDDVYQILETVGGEDFTQEGGMTL